MAHVVGRESYNLHDLGHVSWVGFVCTDPAKHLTTAGYDLDDTHDLDLDLSDVKQLVRRVWSHGVLLFLF